MKAARIHTFGNSEQLHVEDTPRPSPGAGEVLVAIQDAGVNPVDWKIREGKMARTVALPLTSGQDFAGTILEGSAAEGFAPGERVYGFAQGAYAEFAIAKANEITSLPDTLSFAVAAALPTPGLTAMQMLRAAEVREGQKVLVHGAGGNVGSLVVQLARRQGARVAATALGPDIEYVTELGAEAAIDTRSERFEDSVNGADAVIDLVGGELQQRSYAVLRRGGVLVSSVGIADQAAADERGVRTVAMVMQRNTADLAQLAQLAAKGELRVRIAKVLTFPAEARAAQELSQQGHASGKILLRVA